MAVQAPRSTASLCVECTRVGGLEIGESSDSKGFLRCKSSKVKFEVPETHGNHMNTCEVLSNLMSQSESSIIIKILETEIVSAAC